MPAAIAELGPSARYPIFFSLDSLDNLDSMLLISSWAKPVLAALVVVGVAGVLYLREGRHTDPFV